MLVVDTSALVSLAIADSLDDLLAEFDIHTTGQVVEELRETAEYDDAHGNGATVVVQALDDLTTHDVERGSFESSRIDGGEASCVRLCRSLEPDFLVTDDLRALPELQSLVEARVAISPIVLRALVERGRIDDATARARLDELAETRDWLGAPIYRRAMRLFEEGA